MILNSPTISGSLTVTGNIISSGSITLSGSVASASYAATASFVALAQSASNAVSAETASFANAFTVASTLTAQTLVVQTITSSIDFVTGSTRFGSILGNTHVFTGSVSITGSMGIGVAAGTNGTKFISAGSATSFFDAAGTRGISIYPSSAGNIHQITSDYIATSYYSIAITARGTNSDLFISSSGNIGIGTTTPDFPLVVKTDASANSIKIIGRSGGDGLLSFYGSNGTTPYLDFSAGATYVNYNAVNSQNYNWYCNSALKMTLTSTGHLQLNNGTALRFNNTAATAVDTLQMYTDGNVYLDAKDNTGGNLIFRTTTSLIERMRIQSAGQLTFGEGAGTITAYKFRFNGNGAGDVMAIVLNGGTAASTSYIGFRTGTGEGSYKADIRYETGALSLNNISDVRFKENIIDASTNEQWNKVKNSKLRIFDFKDKTCSNQLGFIAQELYQTIPEAISKGGDEEEFDGDEKKIWTIASTNMIPAMFGALQEAMAKIEELQSQINELKAQ